MVNHIELLSKLMDNEEFLEVAKLGKTVGLRGDLKIHFLSDFPEQFKKGAVFHASNSRKLHVENFDKKRSLIRFEGFVTPEDSQKLVNTVLLCTKEQTVKNCTLKKDEYFWFDIVGLDVYEDDLKLGKVSEIERIANVDYLLIKSDVDLVKKGLAKTFLIPYVDRYIIDTYLNEKRIHVKDALGILEQS